MPPAAEPTLPEHVCLGILAGGAAHGWAVVAELAPDGEIGRIWTLSRPLTYRAIDQLIARRLVTRAGTEPGRGRDRQLLRVTADGRRQLDRWLATPVEHVRDVRTELLLKVVVGGRLGVASDRLLRRQRDQLTPLLDALIAAADRPAATPGDDDLLTLWRAENARAVRRFLDAAVDPVRARRRARTSTPLRISARNQLDATVTTVDRGDVMANVGVELTGGDTMAAAITSAAVDDLDLAPGDEVVVVVKSTEVLLAKR